MDTLGKIVVIAAPSGAGKDTVIERLLETLPSAVRLVTYTTRRMRDGEEEGVDYHFIDRTRFQEMIDAGELFEWNEFNGNLYGSSAADIEALRLEHNVVLVRVDINGAREVKARFPGAILIFIEPGSIEELRARHAERGTDVASVEWRIKRAEEEIAESEWFDYRVKNFDGKLDVTVKAVQDIIEAA